MFDNLIYFLYLVEILSSVAIIILMYFVWSKMQQFKHDNHHFESFYDNYKPDVDTDKSKLDSHGLKLSEIENYFDADSTPSEWRLGIVELDNFMRSLMLKSGYQGDNVEELLIDAKEKEENLEVKKFNTLHIATQIHEVRKHLNDKSLNMNLNKDQAVKLLGLYKKVFEELRQVK
jgi:hypothetical protein